MYIISATANGSGGYPPLQEWHSQTCPTGYYFYPNEYFGVFYPQGKRVAGFVKYETDEDTKTVTSVTWNDEAYDAYVATLPDPVLAARENKIAEMSKACNQTIEAGVDCEIGGSVKHYSLTSNDQANITNMFNAILLGADGYPYHADGEQCSEMPKADIIKLYTTAQAFITSQVTYNNMLKGMINEIPTEEEVNNIHYGDELNETWKARYDAEMGKAEAQMQKILANLQKQSATDSTGTEA